MKKNLNNLEIKKYIFFSEHAYIVHMGEHYEDLILQAKDEMKPVITIKNVNGCQSSIPLERALSQLEKYAKLSRQTPKIRQEEQSTIRMMVSEPVEKKESQNSKAALAHPY